LLGVKPDTLFALIGGKLIFSESNSYFEGYLGPFPSNFIILEFEEDKLLDFVLQFVSLYYLLVISEKLLITLSNIEVPQIKVLDIPYLEEENLKLKKTEILRTKIILSKISKEIFSCLRIFDYFSNNDFEFSDEEISSRFLINGKSWDNDSISKYFSDLLSYRTEEIEKRQAHLQEGIFDINNLIISELSLTKNKPKISGVYKKIEADLILQIKKWNGTIISQDKIESWLSNFITNKDRIVALKLLDKLRYITYQEIRPFITAAYNSLLSSINADNLINCYISTIGNLPSGSTHLAKLFQEENQIEDYLFIPFENLESLIETGDKKDTLVLIDDFVGSGNTYIQWYEDHRALLDSFPKVFYVSLTGLQKGINNIERENKTKVICANIFDEDEQVIDGTLFLEDKPQVEELIKKYSSRIASKYVYGYDNSQLLLAFENNIPNNSIGILWWSKNWKPLIERK
jgi:hypothetical protein